jgi:3-methyladenine DNA glycosylase AlkD
MRFLAVQEDLRLYSSESKAKAALRFFKTGPGEYGEGDLFLGVTVPDVRLVAKSWQSPKLTELRHLLRSRFHEDRLLALIVLGELFKREKSIPGREALLNFYLEHRSGVNNWDLVDTSAPQLLGEFALQTGDLSHFKRLARSDRHWDRRMAMVGTLGLIRGGELDLTFELAERFLGETEDLMHKAAGWMLREAGKKDSSRLLSFIAAFGNRMPRTMLRVSIEKFSPAMRKRLLQETKTGKVTGSR